MTVVGWAAGSVRRWPGAVAISLVFGLAVATIFGLLSDSTPVDHGWFLITGVGVGAAGATAGLLGRSPHWLVTRGLAAGVASAALVALGAWWVSGQHLGHYPPSFLAWVWGSVLTVALAVLGLRSGPAVLRTGRVISAPLALFGAFLLINSHYGYWPTVGTLLQRPAIGQVSGSRLSTELQGRGPADPAALDTDLSHAHGSYGPVSIPGSSVGFHAGQAWVWLPPDFSVVDHSTIPVLLMLSGWPGQVQDWTVSGQALAVANDWSAAHDGAAPIMVFVNENGSVNHDTECVDGPQGPAEAYLSQTVPAWIHDTLGVDDDPSRWATVGFSEGGTCAIDLALEHPGIWGRFVDVAGDLAPNWGSTAHQTLVDLYGDDAAAEEAHQPLTLLAGHRYPTTAGWLIAGRQDNHHIAVLHQLAPACAAAGIQTTSSIITGGHNWIFARRAFAEIYPQLMAQLGATAPPGGPG